MSFKRIAAVGGFVVVVLGLLSFILLGNQPSATDSIPEIVRYLGKDTDAHKLSALASATILPFFALFLAGVVTEMRATDRKHGEGWAIVTLVGGIMIGAAAGTGDILLGMLFYRGGSGLDPSVVRVLYDGQQLAYGSAGLAVTALTGGVAAMSLLHGRGPAWYGWLSALVAAAGLLVVVGLMSTSGGVNTFAFLGFPAMMLWVLVTSVLMMRGPRHAAA